MTNKIGFIFVFVFLNICFPVFTLDNCCSLLLLVVLQPIEKSNGKTKSFSKRISNPISLFNSLPILDFLSKLNLTNFIVESLMSSIFVCFIAELQLLILS